MEVDYNPRLPRPVADLPAFPADAWTSYRGSKPPRYYQVNQIVEAWQHLARVDSTLIVSATGTGKTVTFGHTCRIILRVSPRSRILVLVHRDQLLDQAQKKIQEIIRADGKMVEIEQGKYYAERRRSARKKGGPEALPRSSVVVASKDSLCQEYRLRSYDPDEFDWIVVDEAHHCIQQNGSYWAIIAYFAAARLVGVTATPDRKDELALGQTFLSAVKPYGMAQAIADGFLVPVVQQYLTPDGYDLSKVKLTREGDLSESGLAKRISEEKPLQGIVSETIRLSNTKNRWGTKRPAIVFAPSVPCAKLIADGFNRHHRDYGTGRAACISNEDCDLDERRAILDQYREGYFQYVVNYGILTEGFDDDRTRIIVLARSTTSRALCEQMIGRGTRPREEIVPALNAAYSAAERKKIIHESGKPSVLVVDLVGNCRHKLITATDILGGIYDDEVVDAARSSIAKRGGVGDIDAELKAAKKALEEKERLRRAGIVIHAKFQARTVDPFNLFDLPTGGPEPAWFKGKKPSDKQVSFLRAAKVPEREIGKLTMHRASKLIDELIARRNDGRCTYSQAKILARYGFDPDSPFAVAVAVIDAIKAANWPDPGDFDPASIRTANETTSTAV